MPKSSYDHHILLTYKVVLLANTLNRGAARLSGKFALPLSEWRILAVLAIEAPTRATSIGQMLAADKGWVSRTVAALVGKGLVVERGDPEDSRASDIELTIKGRELYRRIVPLALERQRFLLQAFSASEEKTFRRLLDKLQRRAERALSETSSDRQGR